MSLNILRECQRVIELNLDLTPVPKFESKETRRGKFPVPISKFLIKFRIMSQKRFMDHFGIDKTELYRLYEHDIEKFTEMAKEYAPFEKPYLRKRR